MRREDVFFVDKDGRKISSDSIFLHDDLARKIISKNSKLQKEFKESGENSPTVFLILNGYVCVAEDKDKSYITAMYSCLCLTDATRNLLGEYKEEGHEIYDLIKNTLNQEQIEEVKNRLKKEGNTEELRNWINQEFFEWNKVKEDAKEEAR